VLSFTPLVVWVVIFAFSSMFFPPVPMAQGFYHVYQSYYDVYTRTTFAAGTVSFVGSLSALVTSTMARDWAQRFPGQVTWDGLAYDGKVLGIIGMVAIFVVAPCTFLAVAAANYGGG
jgi:hypothetical protein